MPRSASEGTSRSAPGTALPDVTLPGTALAYGSLTIVFPPVCVRTRTIFQNDVIIVRAGAPSGLPFRVLDFPGLSTYKAPGFHGVKVLPAYQGKFGYLGQSIRPTLQNW